MTQWYLYPLLGCVGGVLSNMLGVGAGILFVPALVFIAGLSQKNAQGTTLAVMKAMSVMGTLRYRYNPDITLSWRLILLLTVGAVIGANIGSTIAFMVPGHLLRKVFAVFILFVGVLMLFRK